MSTHPISCAAAALSVLALPALAQTSTPQSASGAPTAGQPTSSAPAASQPTSSAPPASTNSAAPSASSGSNANATISQSTALSPGLTVKDNTGTAIGQIASVDTDSKTGEKMATIKMGKDSFRLQADRLSMADGAATINLTQAQIQAQLHPKQ